MNTKSEIILAISAAVIILAIGFGVYSDISGKETDESTLKFHANDEVIVTGGFHKGCEGVVMAVDVLKGAKGRQEYRLNDVYCQNRVANDFWVTEDLIKLRK